VNEKMTSIGDALWFAVVTIGTVGYGDVTPITPDGRLATSVLIVIAITLWAAITGMMTSLLIESRAADVGVPGQIRRLEEELGISPVRPAEPRLWR